MKTGLSHDNPTGLDGIEFGALATKEPEKLIRQLKELGFRIVAKHRYMQLSLYQEGNIFFYVNHHHDGLGCEFAKRYGPVAFAIGLTVADALYALERSVHLGADVYYERRADGISAPAIYGIGGSIIYFVDGKTGSSISINDLVKWRDEHARDLAIGLTAIDHLTYSLHRGAADKWVEFYKRVFNFHEIHAFKIAGVMGRVLRSPCGKFRISLNESLDDKSLVNTFLQELGVEGLQSIALSTPNIYESVEKLRQEGIKFLEVPATYYEMLEKRLPNHGEDILKLKENNILIDGTPESPSKLLLQAFTQKMVGPLFFEIIERRGNEDFSENNFQTLAEMLA